MVLFKAATSNFKVVKLVFLRRAHGFAGLNYGFVGLFNKIKAAGVGGMPLKDQKGNPMPGTKEGMKAYGDAWKEAKKQVKDQVAKESPESVEWLWKGLELDSPSEKHAEDIENSVLSTWDLAASKYGKLDNAGGDAAAAKLLTRLKEFDTARSSKGAKPVKKDE